MRQNDGESVLLVHARLRTQLVRDRIQRSMLEIEAEIDANEGVYPHNRGRLSIAEVCRRAGVHKVTLQGEAHASTTRPSVISWISGIRNRTLPGRAGKRALASRVRDWKVKYDAVAARMHEIYAIEIPRRDAAILKAESRVRELELLLAASGNRSSSSLT